MRRPRHLTSTQDDSVKQCWWGWSGPHGLRFCLVPAPPSSVHRCGCPANTRSPDSVTHLPAKTQPRPGGKGCERAKGRARWLHRLWVLAVGRPQSQGAPRHLPGRTLESQEDRTRYGSPDGVSRLIPHRSVLPVCSLGQDARLGVGPLEPRGERAGA